MKRATVSVLSFAVALSAFAAAPSLRSRLLGGRAGDARPDSAARPAAAAQQPAVTDDEAVAAFDELCRCEGIIPALESSHALAEAIKRAPTMPKDSILLVCLSGRGDKDLENIENYKKSKG